MDKRKLGLPRLTAVVDRDTKIWDETLRLACVRVLLRGRFVATAKPAPPPSVAVDRFVAPAKPALPPSMAVDRFVAPAKPALPPSMAVDRFLM